jgi:hypothetical protein
MGRIAGAVGANILKGCVGCAVASVYVFAVTLVFFFLPLARMGSKTSPSLTDLVLPFGLGVFFLLVGPALLLAFTVRRRNAGYDAIFGSLGLAGFPYALQFRRYDGAFGGRRLQALLAREPRLVLEAETAVPTRFGITAGAGDTAYLAGLAGKKPIPFAIPAYDGLLVFGEEEAWVRRLLAEPGVPALLTRLLRIPDPIARRQIVLRPGALAVTYHLSTSFFRISLSAEQARDRAEALVELARIAESIPSPVVPLAPTRIEERIQSIRGMGLKVNPGVAALVAILATPLLVGAIAGIVILAGKHRVPDYGPGSHAEARDLLWNVSAAGQSLQVADMEASGVLGQLGTGDKAATVEREDASALHALAKDPPGARIVITKDVATGAARGIEYTLAAPPAIRMRDLEQQWGKPSLSRAPDDPASVVALFMRAPRDGARWPVHLRVRFREKAGGPVTRIGVYRDAGPAPVADTTQPVAGTTQPEAAPAPSGTAPALGTAALLSPCPTSFDMAGTTAVGESRSCVCVYGAVSGTVFGSGRYGPASWICEAAKHAGVLTKPGDAVTFWRQPDCPRLWGSAANGVVSKNAASPPATFSFTPEPPPCPPPPSASAGLEPCPTLFSKELEAMPEGSTFDCTCEYTRYREGSLWGTRVYYIGSSVCDAAQHAGMVGRKGGTVTVFLGGPCDRFWGSKSYGMESESRRKPGRSMAFQQPYPACPGPTDPW